MKSMRAEVEEMKRLRAEGKLWPTAPVGQLPPRGVEENEETPEPELRFENFITENETMNDKEETTEQPKKRRGCPPGGWPKKKAKAEDQEKKRNIRRLEDRARTGYLPDAREYLEEKRRELFALERMVEELEARAAR